MSIPKNKLQQACFMFDWAMFFSSLFSWKPLIFSEQYNELHGAESF